MIFKDHTAEPRSRINGRQKLFICLIDLGIIAELCIAMAAATSVDSEAFTSTFMKTFFAMFLPTLAIGIAGFRKLRDRTESA
ncbi:MAG: hypothetical protein Q8O35_11040 [Humidesulfovibrio sp.]|uniref:hypothetical protein n=1 Tax=Humidesulfovibrio sp. TaxID=2910988 RepID=UPI0027326A51|nr:hypothetical protein [Humidesulfovibrio sp.]MDP2848710.1 hypothetical protein [Humidesulfovibrio sp.]